MLGLVNNWAGMRMRHVLQQVQLQGMNHIFKVMRGHGQRRVLVKMYNIGGDRSSVVS